MRRSEIASLKRGITRALKDPMSNASPWAFTGVGIGVGTLVSLLAVLGVQGQKVSPYVIAAHASLIFVGLFLAVFCGRAAYNQRNVRLECEREMHHELEALNQRAPSQVEESTP